MLLELSLAEPFSNVRPSATLGTAIASLKSDLSDDCLQVRIAFMHAGSKNIPARVKPRLSFALLIIVMMGCTPSRIVYQHADELGGQKDLFVVREDGSNRAVLAQSQDEETACGVTTDRRVVFTRQTLQGGDIYAVNEDGTGLTPVRTTPADEACFGVTGNNMVIFGVTVSVTNHDLYSISVNATPTDLPITLSAAPLDELPMAIGWDNRVVYAKQDAEVAVDGHRYSYNSINDDGSQLTHLVGVFLEPRYVAITPGLRMVWTRPGPPPNGGLFSTTTGLSPTTAALNTFLHNLGWIEDRFCGLTPNGRLLLTSRGFYPVDGIPTGFASIYMMADDGSSRVLINPGPRNYNELCVGATDEWVIVTRYPDTQDPSRGIVTGLWSYPISGTGNPVQLATAPSASEFALSFEGITPGGRVLFSTYDAGTQQYSHSSINPDGSGLALLTVSTGGPMAFTLGQVVYSLQREQEYTLGIVPANGQHAVTLLAGEAVENWASFVYRTDFMTGEAIRCRTCWPFSIVDRGGVPIPSPLPPP